MLSFNDPAVKMTFPVRASIVEFAAIVYVFDVAFSDFKVIQLLPLVAVTADEAWICTVISPPL
jgi:hypothetical protein